MHITFARVGANFGLKPCIKPCFRIFYLFMLSYYCFTPFFNVFFLLCLFVFPFLLCFILYFAFPARLQSVVYSCTKFDTHPVWWCADRRQRLVIQSSRLEQERDLRIPQAVTVLFR